MDIHEEDEQHLKNAHSSAMSVVEKFDDWIKIDCEQNSKMKSIEEINKEILDKILK
jgi:dTMP kinase